MDCAICASGWRTPAAGFGSKAGPGAAQRSLLPCLWPPRNKNRTMPTTVSIVEDNRGTRESLEELLSGDPNLSFLDAYTTGEAAVAGVPANLPDVLLVDINLPGISGIDCVQKLKEKIPALAILMLTAYE